MKILRLFTFRMTKTSKRVHLLQESIAEVDLEPESHELSDNDWIEVDGREWSDEWLLDDARPGRRRCRGKAECVLDLLGLEKIRRQIRDVAAQGYP